MPDILNSVIDIPTSVFDIFNLQNDIIKYTKPLTELC